MISQHIHGKKKLFILSLLTLLTLIHSKSQYRVSKKQIFSENITLHLQYTGKDDYYLKQSSPIIKQAVFIFNCYSYDSAGLKIIDRNRKRFEIPSGGIFPPDSQAGFSYPIFYSVFSFSYQEQPFQFRLARKQNNVTIFSTFQSQDPLILSDYFLQIGFQIDSPDLYGLGERFNPSFKKGQGRWTVFGVDRGEVIDHGEGLQTYGSYPMYLLRQKTGNKKFHLCRIRNSNAMDIVKSKQNENSFLTFKTIGGILDFRLYVKNQNPRELVQNFISSIGSSSIPPFWSLGFHQSRWGYNSSTMLKEVLQKYKQNGLPLDSIWSDLDYMKNLQVFTIDEDKFPLDQMKKITDQYHWIPILDPGILISNNSIPYLQGIKRNVFIQDANGGNFVGKLRVGQVHFVDFLHPNASDYWADMLEILYKKVQFAGLWIDMNEYTSYCDGQCHKPTIPSKFDYNIDLPYTPGSSQTMEEDLISLNATHYGNITEANFHSFTPYLQAKSTFQFLKRKRQNQNPFVLSRSGTFGSNKYAIHWSGDNEVSFEHLKISIADIFTNQLWGYQMMGADICAFTGNTTQQICSRWFQLGSFYPFSRSHNQKGAIPQQPYALGQNVLNSARNNLRLRYQLLKHFYMLLVNSKGKWGIFTPLFFSFPTDSNCYKEQIMDTQFMIGDSLMGTPILTQNSTSRTVYFPNSNWYNYHTHQSFTANQTVSIDNISISDKMPLFLKEGSIIFVADDRNAAFNNTKQLILSQTFTLKIGLQKQNNGQQTATGQILSIKDYNNAGLIQICVRQGCLYYFQANLKEYQGYYLIKMNISKKGISQTIVISALTLYRWNCEAIYYQFDGGREISRQQQFEIRVQKKRMMENIEQTEE